MARVRVRLSEATQPIPAGIYEMQIGEPTEQTYQSGSWGFLIPAKIIEGEHANRSVLTNFVVISEDNEVSAAFFRFANMYIAATGEDAEIDVDTIDEFKDAVRGLVSNLVGQHVSCVVEIEETEEYGKRSRITKWLR